ncbi:MAG: leucine-rich repeat domain-containing protein, partial [Malacoplasma sp.]|nr:leucine-rich repeat domain-containing protein [Malacoplasma sp.]
SMIIKNIKVTFDFDELEFMTTYWKGYNDENYHQVKNGEIIDFTYGLSNIQLTVLDAQGYSYYPDDKILIRIENVTDGNISEWHSSSAAFDCKTNLIIHIISLKADNNEDIYVDKPGNLEALCAKIIPQRVGELHIKGNINAKDLWYIRDNFSNLAILDISEVEIFACNETDPIPAYRGDGLSELPANTLPAYALTGLSKLNYLGLPNNLIGIQKESCSGLSLKAIELPKSLTMIESNAFNLNYNLSTIICKSSVPPAIADNAFINTKIPEFSILICPDGSLQEYSANDYYGSRFSEIICDSNIGISDLSKEQEGIVYALIPYGSIVTGYVQELINKDGITIPDIIIFGNTNRKVLEVADNAFEYCLTKSIVLSENIEKIGNNAFTLASETEHIILPSKLKEISTGMCSGTALKEITIPENIELISLAFDGCINLKRLYIPQKATGSSFYRNMIGSDFESLIEFDVHPDNNTWSAVDGLLYSKDKSTLFNCPGTKSGILNLCKETTQVEWGAFSRCSHLSKIRFTGDMVSLDYLAMNIGYANIDNIEFPQNTYFSGTQCFSVYGLKSMTLGDFTVSIIGGVQCFPNENQKLMVYLKNQKAVEFSETYMTGCSDWEYYTASLINNVSVPNKSQLYVPGGTKDLYGTDNDISISEMWSYHIDRSNGFINIKPEIDGLTIDNVLLNGSIATPFTNCIYKLSQNSDLDVVVNYTLHGRQAMSTHYTPEFNSQLPDSELALPIAVTSIDLSLVNIKDKEGAQYQLTATINPENA